MSPKNKETPSPTPIAKSGIEFSRVEDFSELYANNVMFESSLWDMKLVFGQTDQNIGPNAIVQHTAVTIPWAQAKVLAYTLSLALADQEARSGRIQLKKGIIGEFPEQMPKALRDSGEMSEETWKALRKMQQDFVAANPELALK
ncbi:MAG TPA: DUF3467 domain-containing protein [Candidatus Angelobacter sp.]|jgi:hypothetical protein|nr:DUF3467 domain-containing protein [Candidatus Angelobacter sp.]